MISRIYSKNNYSEELDIVETVKSICQKYNVPAFTNEVCVEKDTIPHSHPILTLNTRSKDERSILLTLTHEQFHWYVQNHQKYKGCIAYLKLKYKDGSVNNESGKYPESYWEHIIVCFNTRNYLKNILSTSDFDWVYQQWLPYPIIEKLIVERHAEIEIDLKKFEMVFIK